MSKERWSGAGVLIQTVAQILPHGTEIEGDLHLQVCLSYLTNVSRFYRVEMIQLEEACFSLVYDLTRKHFSLSSLARYQKK